MKFETKLKKMAKKRMAIERIKDGIAHIVKEINKDDFDVNYTDADNTIQVEYTFDGKKWIVISEFNIKDYIEDGDITQDNLVAIVETAIDCVNRLRYKLKKFLSKEASHYTVDSLIDAIKYSLENNVDIRDIDVVFDEGELLERFKSSFMKNTNSGGDVEVIEYFESRPEELKEGFIKHYKEWHEEFIKENKEQIGSIMNTPDFEKKIKKAKKGKPFSNFFKNMVN